MKREESGLEHIQDEKLIKQLFEMAGQSFKERSMDKRVTQEQTATMYSLFKQATLGDADEFPDNKSKPNYALWKQ